MTATIAPLLGGLFLILAIGVVLRARAGMGQAQADTLNTIIVDVAMPALIVSVLVKRDLAWSTSIALVPATLAMLTSGMLAFLAVRALQASRGVQGSAALVAAFCNTGFLGFPLLLSVFPGDARASSTALLIDTVDTTLLLWTLGLAFAHRLGNGERFDARAVAAAVLRPLTLSIPLGVALRLAHVELPGFLDGALDTLGRCASPLVFLSLGLQLDVRALRGRVGSVALVSALKLIVAPLVCLAIVRAMNLDDTIASVAVLQCAMPSAMVSVIVAARGGCDRPFAAGVATVTTVLCIVTLPAVSWLLE